MSIFLFHMVYSIDGNHEYTDIRSVGINREIPKNGKPTRHVTDISEKYVFCYSPISIILVSVVIALIIYSEY